MLLTVFNGMAILIDGKVLRRCSKCSVTEDVITFWKCRDTKNGKIYTHNICIPCRKDQQSLLRRAKYYANRKREIAKSAEWNRANRARIRKLSKIRRDKKRKQFLFRGLE